MAAVEPHRQSRSCGLVGDTTLHKQAQGLWIVGDTRILLARQAQDGMWRIFCIEDAHWVREHDLVSARFSTRKAAQRAALAAMSIHQPSCEHVTPAKLRRTDADTWVSKDLRWKVTREPADEYSHLVRDLVHSNITPVVTFYLAGLHIAKRMQYEERRAARALLGISDD